MWLGKKKLTQGRERRVPPVGKPDTVKVLAEPTPEQIVTAFSGDITMKHSTPEQAARFIDLSGENAVQQLQAILTKDSEPTPGQLNKMRLWLGSPTEKIRSLLAEEISQ